MINQDDDLVALVDAAASCGNRVRHLLKQKIDSGTATGEEVLAWQSAEALFDAIEAVTSVDHRRTEL